MWFSSRSIVIGSGSLMDLIDVNSNWLIERLEARYPIRRLVRADLINAWFGLVWMDKVNVN
jgi:hypothetical protein